MRTLEKTYLEHDIGLLQMIASTVGLELAAGNQRVPPCARIPKRVAISGIPLGHAPYKCMPATAKTYVTKW